MKRLAAAVAKIPVVAVVTALCLATGVVGQDRGPTPGAPPVVRDISLAFPTQDGHAMRQVEDYWATIGLPRPSPLHPGPTWTLYALVEPMILDGAQRLWSSGQFHSVWVDVADDPFPNGALAKRVIFNLVERAQPATPPRGLPQPPPGYEIPPPSHERVYPPPVRR